VVIWLRLFIIIYSCEGIECSSNLEYFAELILEELLESAVMIETEVGKIVESVLNIALKIDIVVEAIQKSHQLENLHEIECGCDFLDVVHLHGGLS